MESLAAPPLLEVRRLGVRFGAVTVLDAVELALRRGEVVALLGQNGAGKSTLLNALAGVLRPSAGSIALDGRPLDAARPRDAELAGVAMVHQELALVPELSVAENIALGAWSARAGFVDRTACDERARAALAELELALDPRERVGDLSLGLRQMVEIARALSRRAKLLILDEPTSALSTREVDALLATLAKLRERGELGMLFVSHRLDEVRRVASRAVVLRGGRVALDRGLDACTDAELVTAMLGHAVEAPAQSVARRGGERVLLAAHGWSVPSRDGARTVLREVDFELRAGEVLGLAGLLGAGRSELLESLCGASSARGSGSLALDGAPFRPRSPRASLRAGLAFVGEDRALHGLVPDADLRANHSLSRPRSALGWLLERRERGDFEASRRSLQLQCADWRQPIRELSGGNQQKLLLGRALLVEPKVLLLDEPTRGVDVGAKEWIQRRIRELAVGGVGVIVVTSEIAELERVASRVLVLAGGRVARELRGADVRTSRITAALAGEAA